MVESKSRPLSVDGADLATRKRQKTDHVEAHFATDLLEQVSVDRLHEEYAKSEPYKHVVVEKLFQDELVEKVKNECIRELSFTEKETDIYKVRTKLHCMWCDLCSFIRCKLIRFSYYRR